MVLSKNEIRLKAISGGFEVQLLPGRRNPAFLRKVMLPHPSVLC